MKLSSRIRRFNHVRNAERHIRDKHGLSVFWGGPGVVYTDGTKGYAPSAHTKYACLAIGDGPTKSKAIRDLHFEVHGRKDLLTKSFLRMYDRLYRSVLEHSQNINSTQEG